MPTKKTNFRTESFYIYKPQIPGYILCIPNSDKIVLQVKTIVYLLIYRLTKFYKLYSGSDKISVLFDFAGNAHVHITISYAYNHTSNN